MSGEIEVWKDVVGYEGIYQVSNFGRIKSLERIFKRSHNIGMTINKEKIRKTSKHSSGYLRIPLTKNRQKKYHYVHILVLEAFVGKRPNKQDADHRNSIRTDNRLNNLRWLNRKENRGKSGYSNNNSKIKRYVRSK